MDGDMEEGSDPITDPKNNDESEVLKHQSKARLSYRDAVRNDVPKDIFFNENVKEWLEGEEEGDGIMKDSQSIDLNENPLDVDPILPIMDFPKQLIKKIHLPSKDCLIVKLLGKSIG